jgi:hypothetical protein
MDYQSTFLEQHLYGSSRDHIDYYLSLSKYYCQDHGLAPVRTDRLQTVAIGVNSPAAVIIKFSAVAASQSLAAGLHEYSQSVADQDR